MGTLIIRARLEYFLTPIKFLRKVILKWFNSSGHSFKIEIPFLEEEFNDNQSEEEMYPGV